jgi:serine phosphatase RsbU (regulator of sigma subunit)
MKKPDDKIRSADIYRDEYVFLEDAQQTVENADVSQETLWASYRALLAEHDILLRKIVKMTGISDRMQRKLRDANIRIEAQQEAFRASIRYAEKIQRALLPDSGEVKTYLPKSFFLWMPRDIVGGDIYFATRLKNGIIIAVIDCTGHGVPGAFMSMIASSFIRRITADIDCHDPPEILRKLSGIVKMSLHQDREDASSDDGLDAGICFIETDARGWADGSSGPPSARRVIFSGAKLPLFYVRNREMKIIKGDRQSLGYKRSDPDFEFTSHIIPVERGMSFYMSTDGFWSQLREDRSSHFGVRIFGKKRFAELLSEISPLPFDMQRERLVKAFQAHRGDMITQDDVTVAGFGF